MGELQGHVASLIDAFSKARSLPSYRSTANALPVCDQPQDRQGAAPRSSASLLARADEVIE
jgi:hypothetical protein